MRFSCGLKNRWHRVQHLLVKGALEILGALAGATMIFRIVRSFPLDYWNLSLLKHCFPPCNLADIFKQDNRRKARQHIFSGYVFFYLFPLFIFHVISVNIVNVIFCKQYTTIKPENLKSNKILSWFNHSQ